LSPFGSLIIDHHRLQKYLAGYYREKKREKVHLHIQLAKDSLPRHSLSDGGCHVLFISNPSSTYNH